jgi:UDP-N-acetylglucosamine diphosphorylase/glucosamine-1-phosphate N-acetyltransferase
MNIVLFDPDSVRGNLLPLTYTRPISEIRIGIDTISQKWQSLIPASYFYDTVEYLKAKFPPCPTDADFRIAANIIPDFDLANAIKELNPGQALYSGDKLIAVRGNELTKIEYHGEITAINMLFDIFMLNDKVLRADFARITANSPQREVSDTVTVIGDKSQLFIHADAGDVEGCIINVSKGPVYIGPGAEVMEGVCMRGPIAICQHATINMGAKIYGATTIGPWCKVGGEVNNAVIFGFSNKAHDGFLGNAVIGEWCNIGAECVASNLKNDYTEIKLWNYPAHRFLRTGLQFCGLIMGDHSKAGINTMLNTATVLGVGVNIHGSGFPRPFLASFSEGSTAGFSDVPMRKFFDTARTVMARRNIQLSDIDIEILSQVRELAEQYR